LPFAYRSSLTRVWQEFVGLFERGARHGKGILRTSTGDVLPGFWRHNSLAWAIRSGASAEELEHSASAECEWRND
jgi:hypothetical protein